MRTKCELLIDGTNCNEIYFGGKDAARSPHIRLSYRREEKLRTEMKKVGWIGEKFAGTKRSVGNMPPKWLAPKKGPATLAKWIATVFKAYAWADYARRLPAPTA